MGLTPGFTSPNSYPCNSYRGVLATPLHVAWGTGAGSLHGRWPGPRLLAEVGAMHAGPWLGWSRTPASLHTPPRGRPTCLRPGPRGSAEVQALSQSEGTARKPGLLFSLCDPRASIWPGTCHLHLLSRVLFPGCFLGFWLIFVPLILSLQMDHHLGNPAYIATQGPLPATVANFWQVSLQGVRTLLTTRP